MLKYKLLSILIFLIAVIACSDFGDKIVDGNGDDPADTTISYADDVQPIFNAHCSSCHVGGNQGGLSLDDYSNLIQGGESGAVVIAGDPDNSILVRRLEGDLDLMPPSEAIPTAEIDIIRQWIAEGALDN